MHERDELQRHCNVLQIIHSFLLPSILSLSLSLPFLSLLIPS